jgi:ribonucleoside-triphosphate reductase
MDTTEGCHKPAGKYIFNNVNFSVNDPLLPKLREAGYHVVTNPIDDNNALVTFPVNWENIRFDKEGELYVNNETALEQLARYKLLMGSYVEQNCSITVSYKEDEVPAIRDWLKTNWSSYVGVSFLPVTNSTYEYLPQEVVTEQRYKEYVAQLTEVDFGGTDSALEMQNDECESGVCPVK